MTTRKIVPQAKKMGEISGFRNENPFLALRNDVDRIFDRFFRGLDVSPFTATASMFHPSVDIADNGKEIRVTVELPGMDEKDIDISLTRDSLTIQGEKKESAEENNKNYHRMERVYGSFSRTVPLPVEVTVDNARATYKKGVLSIVVPKTEKALKEARKITIKER